MWNKILLKLIFLIGLSGTDYWVDRSKLIDLEASLVIGANITLNIKEEEVNDILMKLKLHELDNGLRNPKSFPPARHFFESKPDIEKSEVFNFIKLLPKGASLHSHDVTMASIDYVYNLTYRENLYGCVHNNRLVLHFLPNNSDIFCNWTLVSTLRRESSSFDHFLKSQISIIANNPFQAYEDVNEVWKKFDDTFETLNNLLTYVEVFKDYFYQALQELYEDNVMYLEFRCTLLPLYDLDGKSYGPVEVAGIYLDTLNKFKCDHPDFHGGRLIYAPLRQVTNATVAKYVEIAVKIKETFADFITGFDLVGQEDLSNSLIDFLPHLLKLSKKMRFFFHAGETKWNGITDLNLVDAVLLNASRIGHGYALLKHPVILNIIKERGTPIEVCPISNQVLKLVNDMRNHPASVLFNQGFNVVICNDDPAMWGTKGLSYDWYMAYMGMASRRSDLRLLKQLAMNSVLGSAMGGEERKVAMKKWNEKWEEFIDYVIRHKSEYQIKNNE